VAHVDPDILALLALGEQDAVDPSGRAHLASCPECSAAVDELRRTVAVGRSLTDDDLPSAPSPAVWQAVHAELGLAPELAADPLAARPPAAEPALEPALMPSAEPALEPVLEPSTEPSAEPAVVVPLRARRRSTWAWTAAAACLALVIGVGAGATWMRRGATPPGSTVASATLDALPAWPGASGEARLEKEPDGTRRLVVSLAAGVPDDGFREVWLIRDDLGGLVSLGVLDGTEGTFDVPAGLDTSRYSLVDVSQEPLDGNPAHSSDSIVRGPLV
jgi:hypothetical protein